MKCYTKKTGKKFNKCIPFIIAGAVLLLVGIPMMLAGIIGAFQYSDLIGYIGGAFVFFGLLFLFVWYVITIPNLENMKLPYDDDLERNSRKVAGKKDILSYNNQAFVTDSQSNLFQKTSTGSLGSKTGSSEQVEMGPEEIIDTSSTKTLNSNNSNNVFLVHNKPISRSDNKLLQHQVETTTISGVHVPDYLQMTALPE